MTDGPVKLYIDCSVWDDAIKIDDFLVAIGKTKSNSVYHVASVKASKRGNGTVRYHVETFSSDLITALKRDNEQKLITLYWYPRNKKLKNQNNM